MDKTEFQKENKNPLNSYWVTDKEFEFYEKFYWVERKAFVKGFLVATVLVTAISILIAIAI